MSMARDRMSEPTPPAEIQQTVTEARYAATSATGSASIQIINYNYSDAPEALDKTDFSLLNEIRQSLAARIDLVMEEAPRKTTKGLDARQLAPATGTHSRPKLLMALSPLWASSTFTRPRPNSPG